MAVILLNGAEPFEYILNILSTEGSMKNCSIGFRKRTFKNYTVLYMYIAYVQGQITPRGQKFDCN